MCAKEKCTGKRDCLQTSSEKDGEREKESREWRTKKGRKKGREKEKRESYLGVDQTELRERASIIINQDVNNEGTDGSESGQRNGGARRTRPHDRIALRCIVVASQTGYMRRRTTHGCERIVTGINAFRPRDRDLSPVLDFTEFDFILYADRPFNEINAAREVN